MLRKAKKIIIIFLIGLFIYLFISTQIDIVEAQNELQDVKQKTEKLCVENQKLEYYQSHSDEYILYIARNQLDYSFPDETVYILGG